MDLCSNRGFLVMVLVMKLFLTTKSINGLVTSGCELKELGIKVPNIRRVPDKDITASSQLSNSYASFRGRIGVEVKGSWGDGWCASMTDPQPFIQVFFEFLTIVTKIETVGVIKDGDNMWVQSYTVSTSNDSVRWTTYPKQGNATKFPGNTDIQAKNNSLGGSWAHFIRVYPDHKNGSLTCMRIALYGCDTANTLRKNSSVAPGVVLVHTDAPLTKDPLGEVLFLVVPFVLFGCILLAALMCFCCCRRSKKARKGKIPSRATSDASQEKVSSGVIYEEPSRYEFQTVALDFGHDGGDQKDGEGAKPIFEDDNKFFSFHRQVVDDYT